MLSDKIKFNEYLENLAKYLQFLWYKHDGKPEVIKAITTIDMVIESYAREHKIDLSKVNCIPDMEEMNIY